MKAQSKAILFTRVIHDRKTHQWPVAAFGSANAAKQYAVWLYQAHQHGDAEGAVKLDPRTVLDSEGNLAKGAKFSVQVIPYAPEPDMGVADTFDIEDPVTV